MHRTTHCRKSQTGAVAIVVGVSLAVLVGFAGLALDLGRLYINKTELQNAVDACALAAAVDLNCDPDVAGSCTAAKILKSEAAGIFAAGRNLSDFQKTPVTSGNNKLKVEFSTEFVSNYALSGSADPKSKYAKCTAESQGILPWFMGVLGLNKKNIVSAFAVATLGPGQTFCGTLPMGVCVKPGSTQSTKDGWGYTINDWMSFVFNTDKDIDDDVEVDPESQFRWVDFDPNAGGASEVRDRLSGENQVCGLKIGDDIKETGEKQGVKSAYNTRFGLYDKGTNAYKPQTAPPDLTGYAYPNQSPATNIIGLGQTAYADYLNRQSSHDLFVEKEYPDGNKVPGSIYDDDQHKNWGSNRRLVSVPVISCDTGNVTAIKDMACVLMLNPMNKGVGKQTIYLEFRGLVKNANVAECQSTGLPGKGGSKVPQLVQ